MIEAAFWLLAIVFASRLYLVMRHKADTAFLAATGVGVVGLFCTGHIVPEAQLDALIGGHNWLHLLRNLLVTAAVWLVREGVFTALSRNPGFKREVTHRPVFLAAMLLFITIPFTLQSFIPSTETFVPDAVHQPAIYAYATAYMSILGFLGLSVFKVSIGHRDSKTVRASATVVGAGMSFLVLGCIDEIIYMTLRFAGLTGPLMELTYTLFSPLFYSGIVLTSLGLGIPPAVRLWRRVQVVDRFWILVLYIKFPPLQSPATSVQDLFLRVFGSHPTEQLYQQVIAVGDRHVTGYGSASIHSADRALASAQRRLAKTSEPLGLELMKREDF